jgi:hypothetical protein
VIAMQHSFTNDTIYKNIFCLLRENNFYLSRVVINGILEYGTRKDVCMEAIVTENW